MLFFKTTMARDRRLLRRRDRCGPATTFPTEESQTHAGRLFSLGPHTSPASRAMLGILSADPPPLDQDQAQAARLRLLIHHAQRLHRHGAWPACCPSLPASPACRTPVKACTCGSSTTCSCRWTRRCSPCWRSSSPRRRSALSAPAAGGHGAADRRLHRDDRPRAHRRSAGAVDEASATCLHFGKEPTPIWTSPRFTELDPERA